MASRFGTTTQAPGSLGLAIQQAGGNMQLARANYDAQQAGFASAEAQAVNRMARNQFEAKAAAAGIPLSEAYATIQTPLTNTSGIVNAINTLPGPKTETPTTTTTTTPTTTTTTTPTTTTQEKQGPDYGKMFSDAIAGFQTTLTDQITAMNNQFIAQQKAQEEQMAALRQSMLESQVRSYDRPEVAGVKTATGSSGTEMQIARRGAKGAFGRTGLRISSLNI